MERLQAAIEKARQMRQSSAAVRRTPRRAGEPPPEAVAQAWEALREMEVPRAESRRNRLVSLTGGDDASAYSMLRTRVLQQAQENGWRRVAVVSPHSDCGKTTTVSNLAFSIGRQRDLRTLVFDFDLRRIGLGRVLGQKVEHNMADVLEKRVPFAEHGLRHGHNLAFCLNSAPVTNPSELLQSVAARGTLAEIEATYRPDIVLFDMPPLMSGDENFGFLKNVDCALLIAEAERTTVEQVDVAERQLAELTNVLGVVLNKCRFAGGAYGHDYTYA